MTLNQVYKKDGDSGDGSVSPGLSQTDDLDDNNDSSLVDIFIQNSKPSVQHGHSNMGSNSSKVGPKGPVIPGAIHDMGYMQQPSDEHSIRRLNGSKTNSVNRNSGSFN